ncbi:Bug family tripartite tricarboxylate transporter substrate binding protein [Hydrogenophaga sp. MI9]|uniref:Bug family tripartite tricarboxylate transporter substrate binding protein n=1 Tax=Hydrogenophaga sp. MI9 TaxID=3453719 RepID=UPI003EEC7AAD
MNRFRRHAVAALACTALPPFAASHAQAPAWPAKPVTFVNNFPPGGPSDLLARSVAAVLQEGFKQPFVVENKAGAGGNLGAAQVAKAAPDGQTVLFGIDTAFTINPHLYPSMPFKPGDLKPVVIMASSGLLIGVNPATGIKTFGDLMSKGRQQPLNFSSGGNGSPGHLAAAILSSSTPVKTQHVPYRGNTPAVTAVLSGEVDGGILATPGMLPHVQSGKITALAVTSARRSQLAPQLPTVAELGLKALESEVLYLVMVPAATPDAVVQTLSKGIVDALQRPDIKERMKGLDLFFEGQTGAAATKRLADLNTRYGQIVRSTGMKAD